MFRAAACAIHIAASSKVAQAVPTGGPRGRDEGWKRGLPSSTTAEHAFASFFLRIKRALVSSALGTVDAVRGAGGFDFSSTCTPKVLVS
eukprot:CAMPEP_0178466538 /NCGR_PEP_ID=MMETSP0689_2-20121128/51956_1 /TAXON_ID=160604 /ORGANISM="Amphidinium massartii, Strain CS-259" /LENGTH=88 /DNA_ID=CAMNT_0020093567 /DNA_START=286 /DNA_END=550 /DNA_ORIENTATION=+